MNDGKKIPSIIVGYFKVRKPNGADFLEYALLFTKDRLIFVFLGWGVLSPLGFGSRSSDFGAGLFERERLITAGELESDYKQPLKDRLCFCDWFTIDDGIDMHDEEKNRDALQKWSMKTESELLAQSEFNFQIMYEDIKSITLKENNLFAKRINWGIAGSFASGKLSIKLQGREIQDYIIASKGVRCFDTYRKIINSFLKRKLV
jgi:hypothetical protein